MIFLQIDTPVAVQELTILELIMKGGVIMIPIAILSFISIYLFIERFMYLNTIIKSEKNFVPTVIGFLKESNIKAAANFADKSTHATGYIISSGISMIGRSARDIEATMESATNIKVAEMERNLGYLGIIAGVAPMLGFLGTIAGIIHIFYDISLSDNISIGIIAGGLYEKMITSGAGLLVGVIAYTFYHLLHQKIQRFTLQIQKDVFQFMRSIQS